MRRSLLEESRWTPNWLAGQIRKSAVTQFIATALGELATGIEQSGAQPIWCRASSRWRVDETSDPRRVFDPQQYIGEVLGQPGHGSRKLVITVQPECAANIAMGHLPGSPHRCC